MDEARESHPPTWVHELPEELLGVPVRAEIGDPMDHKPRSQAAQLRFVLARAGGVASVHFLGLQLSLSPRRVRDLLRGSAVRKLGGGYVALAEAVQTDVAQFCAALLTARGPMAEDALISAILVHYPNGDPVAVRAWLRQQPGRLSWDGEHFRARPRPDQQAAR